MALKRDHGFVKRSQTVWQGTILNCSFPSWEGSYTKPVLGFAGCFFHGFKKMDQTNAHLGNDFIKISGEFHHTFHQPGYPETGFRMLIQNLFKLPYVPYIAKRQGRFICRNWW